MTDRPPRKVLPPDGTFIRPRWSKGPCLTCGGMLKDHDADPIGEGLIQYSCPEPR